MTQVQQDPNPPGHLTSNREATSSGLSSVTEDMQHQNPPTAPITATNDHANGGSCGQCGRHSLQKCADPCNVFYCNRKCQKQAWKKHKQVCESRKIKNDAGTIRYPIQIVVNDALAMACKSLPAMRGREEPTESILVLVKMETLEVKRSSYVLQACMGRDCAGMIDEMAKGSKSITHDGTHHRSLVQHFGRSCNRQDLIGIVLRIDSLVVGDIGYELVGPDPNDSDFVILKPAVTCAAGFTRVFVQNYGHLITTRVVTTHFPLILTGHRIPGSPVHESMMEQERHGRECVVCGESKQQITLSDCDHPICFDCGNKWREQHLDKTVTCPLCRQPWVHFGNIYAGTIERAFERNHFERSRCCWCGKIAKYRCGCQIFDYCSFQCKQAHESHDHQGKCVDPWFLPESERLGYSNGCLFWTGEGFTEIKQK
jgi:hypothetical protein